jgi:hypothetical protein
MRHPRYTSKDKNLEMSILKGRWIKKNIFIMNTLLIYYQRRVLHCPARSQLFLLSCSTLIHVEK